MHKTEDPLTLVLLDPYIYIRSQANFTPNNISLKWILQFVVGACSVRQVTQFRRCIFSEHINSFRHLKLEIALAIPASNDEKYY